MVVWAVELLQGLGYVSRIDPQAEAVRALLKRCAFWLCLEARPDECVDRFA
ncbi:hypothetical protein BH24ACT14_BH24ACT14_11610 [soil metagenome]